MKKGKLGYSPLISFSILESSYLIENGNINSKMDLKEEREINNREGDFSYYSILLETGSLFLSFPLDNININNKIIRCCGTLCGRITR